MQGGRAAARGAGARPKSTIDRLVRDPGKRDRLELALTLGVSERRLLGWEPEERHEHYDAEGNVTGYTVTTRDPEFDDAELEGLLAFLAYRRGICSCGHHESLTSDKANFFTIEKRTCGVCRSVAQYARLQAAEDQAVEKRLENSPPATPRPSDGRTTYTRQMSPFEVEARRARQPQ